MFGRDRDSRGRTQGPTEPPAALADLEAAIEGQPVDADQERLAEAIAAVDAALIGFDETDLAAAATEAVR